MIDELQSTRNLMHIEGARSAELRDGSTELG
jgi:hypothetical protein